MALLRIEPPPMKEDASFNNWVSRLWNALRSGATQVDLGADVSGTLPIANGGTAATTAAGARTNLNVPSRTGGDASGIWPISITGSAGSAGSVSWIDITDTPTTRDGYGISDVPKTDGTDATGTWSISISGNAATVTNGVYTTGSYNDPSWLTGLGVAKINCTATNDNAAAGDLGEYLESVVESGSAVSLTTDTPANVTSLSLTAGDWDVRILTVFDPAVSTTVSDLHTSLSTTSATHNTSVDRFAHMSTNLGAGAHQVSLQMSQIRVSLASTTTHYLVAEAAFAASTCAAYGLISARRVR